MRMIFRPLVAWPGALTRQRTSAPFTATWTDTLQLLDREVDAIAKSRNAEVVLQVALSEHYCRLDGMLRANAPEPEHPGVIISFESKFGPLQYATDQFESGSRWRRGGEGYKRVPGWQSNVRAIALSLEALRKVDRYGVSKRGEQYVGWGQLPPGRPMGAAKMTVEEAARLLADAASHNGTVVDPAKLISEPGLVTVAYRVAARRHHPDAGGDPAVFRRIVEARDLLVDQGRVP